MSVASRNPYAVLNDEEDSPAPSREAKPSAPKAPTTTQKKEQPQKSSTRGGRYYQRGGAPKPRDEPAPAQEAPAERSDRSRGRGRGGERGRGRGGRGGRDPRPDRHSQTGKVDTEKRVNSGWGAEEGRTELAAEQSGAADATADAAANEWGAPASNEWGAPAEGDAEAKPAEGEEQGERRPREEEEEDNTMTLSEYLAKKKASDVVPAKPEARAANEGADNSLWKDTVQLQRDSDEENYFIGKTKAAPKARARKDKVHLEIEARFAPIERGGRGRGGDRGRGDRGRGRGRGGAGRDFGSRRTESNLNISDEAAFPSLS